MNHWRNWSRCVAGMMGLLLWRNANWGCGNNVAPQTLSQTAIQHAPDVAAGARLSRAVDLRCDAFETLEWGGVMVCDDAVESFCKTVVAMTRHPQSLARLVSACQEHLLSLAQSFLEVRNKKRERSRNSVESAHRNLNDAEALRIRELRAGGMALVDIAAEYDIDPRLAGVICRGERYRSAGGPITRTGSGRRKRAK